MDYIIYIIGFIFFLLVLIFVVYIYQINSRNLPVNPIITDFGVTISDSNLNRFATLQNKVYNLGPSTFPVFNTSIFMVMVDDTISQGDATTGWTLSTLNRNNPNIVSILNNFTGNYIGYFVDSSGVPTIGGALREVSNTRPVYLTANDPVPVGQPLGWFEKINVGSVLDPNTQQINTIIQLKTINPSNYFISIGTTDPLDPTQSALIVSPNSPTINKNFVISS